MLFSDIDECISSPCKGKEACTNMPGSYLCNATSGGTGGELGFVFHLEVVVVISTMFVFGIFLSPLNMHVIIIALPCWYADCMDPASSTIFLL